LTYKIAVTILNHIINR